MASRITFADSVQPDFGVPWVDTSKLVEELGKDEGVGALKKLGELVAATEELKRKQEFDPVEYGYVLPSWERVMKLWQLYSIICVLGGNRAAKSILMSRMVVWLAENIPEAEIYCFHSSERRSIDDQQRFVWEALRSEHREKGRVRTADFNLQYSQANGFVGSKIILPPKEGAKRGSAIYFHNYNQYKQDDRIAEGWKAHFIWCDEEAPVDLFATLLLRLGDYKGRMALTFTTVTGWTPLVARILGRTRTLKKRWAKLVQRDLPTLQESQSQQDCVIHYFWTEDNPFIPQEGWMKKLEGRPVAERLARAYGVPQKSATTVFPKFGDHNVVEHNLLPWMRADGLGDKYPMTRYMVIDGAGARNWFMVWVAVDAAGTWWVYDEWPDVPSCGEWAVPGPHAGGAIGPAQQSLGFGSQEYVELVKRLEKGVNIFERVIDPRFASTEKQLKFGTVTPMEELAELGLEVVPAPGVHEDAGIQLLNTLLSYDETKPVSLNNSPKFFVSERCQNLIFAMKEYTGTAGRAEPTKDPVDCVRYLAVAKIEHVDLTSRPVAGVGSY